MTLVDDLRNAAKEHYYAGYCEYDVIMLNAAHRIEELEVALRYIAHDGVDIYDDMFEQGDVWRIARDSMEMAREVLGDSQ